MAEKCIHGDDCALCKAEREEALRRITERGMAHIRDYIFDIASPEELERGRFDRMEKLIGEAVTEAVARASTGRADDLTVEGFLIHESAAEG